MKRKITTYEDLEKEERLLKGLLQSQKELIQIEVKLLKKQLEPAHMAVQFLGKITTPDKHNPLLRQGANTVIDMVLKDFVLSKSGWVTKLLIPLFVKNYSSHLIADNKDTIIHKVASLFTSKNGKHKTESAIKNTTGQ